MVAMTEAVCATLEICTCECSWLRMRLDALLDEATF
tara:strand:- start:8 stop:115 length:108 start_codon:yes stop_codon:yes gene_type:complete